MIFGERPPSSHRVAFAVVRSICRPSSSSLVGAFSSLLAESRAGRRELQQYRENAMACVH